MHRPGYVCSRGFQTSSSLSPSPKLKIIFFIPFERHPRCRIMIRVTHPSKSHVTVPIDQSSNGNNSFLLTAEGYQANIVTTRQYRASSEKYDCHETFETQVEASNHDITNHFHMGSTYRRNEQGRVMCPFASNLTCTTTFERYQDVQKHLSSTHPGLQLPCPVVTENGCQGTFKSMSTLGTHINQHHRSRQQHVCPWAEGANCEATFTFPSQVQAHVRKVHERRRFPCPFADEHDCNHTFASQGAAQEHAKVAHENIRYPCPLAKENNSELVFRSKTAANIHASSAHENRRFPCPQADEHHCLKTFASKQDAKKHSLEHLGIKFPCP